MHYLFIAFGIIAAAVAVLWLLNSNKEEGGGNRGLLAFGSNPCVAPLPYGFVDEDYVEPFQQKNCRERCTSQLAACRQACANMPLCDQRSTCRQGCDKMARQCAGRCPCPVR